MKRQYSLMIAFIFLAGAVIAPAELLHVPSEYPTIRKAVEAALSGDEVVIAPGVYAGPDDGDITINTPGITIRGATTADDCIIDGEGIRPGFFISSPLSGSVQFRDLTIRNGFSYAGSAILAYAGDISIRRCRFESNGVSVDGTRAMFAAVVTVSPAAIEDCEFIANDARVGGGIYTDSPNTLIRRCRFERNRAADPGATQDTGGGGAFLAGTCVVEDCDFEENVSHNGGAVLCTNSVTFNPINVSVRRSEFRRNAGMNDGGFPSWGGAVAAYTSSQVQPVAIEECLFTENAGERGSAGYFGGFCRVTRCVFEGNVSPQSGIGSATVVMSSGAVMRDCIVRAANNAAFCALYNSVDVIDCTFEYNELFCGNYQGIARIERCLIRNNRRGIEDTVLSPIFRNSLILNNGSESGALVRPTSRHSEAIFVNCIIAGNWNSSGIGALVQGPPVGTSGTVRFQNSIVIDNGDQPINAMDPARVQVSHSIMTPSWPDPSLPSALSRFVDTIGPDGIAHTGDEDYRLLSGAPGIDGGSNIFLNWDLADLDGDRIFIEPVPFDRAQNARAADDPITPDTGSGTAPLVDIGPYEFSRPCLQAGDLDADGDCDLPDLAALLSNFGAVGDLPGSVILADGDTDLDRDVDLIDLATLLTHFGSACEAIAP